MKGTFSATILDESSGSGTNLTVLVDEDKAQEHERNVPEFVYMKLTSAFSQVPRPFLGENFSQLQEKQ